MGQLKWIAKGSTVYLVVGDKETAFCTMSKELLTPKLAAEDTAAALNKSYK